MSPRNGLKLAYTFFDYDIKALIEVKVLQKLASLASRASQICPFMKPFGQELYRMAVKAVVITILYIVNWVRNSLLSCGGS